MKVLFAVLFWGLYFFPLQAQVQKFGDISRADLEMEVYDLDSSASAVVLFEVGESELNYVNNLFQLSTKIHRRSKVFTDDALELADVSIGYRVGDSEQKVNNVRASSYCLDDNNEIVESSIGKGDTFTENTSSSWAVLKFSIPNVRSGCIIEYEYDKRSENPIDFPDWYFQGEYPTLWSEYNTKIPQFFKFLTVTRGYQEYFIQESSDYNERYTIRPSAGPSVMAGQQNAGRSNQGMQDFMVEGIKNRYVMKDVPAILSEPYMKAKIDYLAHVRYQLAGVEYPGSLPERIIKTWEEIVASLDEYRNYGDRLKSSSTLKEVANNVVKGHDSNLDKMIALYNHVQEKIKWDKSYRLYVEKSLEEYYNEGLASSTAMNFVLIQLLREAGFQAYPIMVSTAGNGEIIGLFPEHGQFNSTITYVAVDENYYLLDPKNEYHPYTILPSNIIGTEGLMLYTKQLVWLPIDQIVKSTSLKNISIEISQDSIRGDASVQFKGLFAVNAKELLSDEQQEKAIRDKYFGSDSKVNLTKLDVNNADVVQGVDFNFEFAKKGLEEYSTFYFNPMIMGRLSSNPFNLENRTYPVDFDYTFDENMVMTITIPENWQVDELPTPVLYRLPGRAGEFRRIIKAEGNTITLNFRYKIDKMRFMPEEYEVLKGMYDQMVVSLNENIVFTKL